MRIAACSATAATSVTIVAIDSSCTPFTLRSHGIAPEEASNTDGGPREEDPEERRNRPPRRSDQEVAIGIAVQRTRSPSSRRCPSGRSPSPSGAPGSTPRTIAQRRSGASTSASVRRSVRRSAPRRGPLARGQTTGSHTPGDARVPANQGVGDRLALDRSPDRPAAPDDVRVGHDELGARAPHDRQPPRAEGERGAPGGEEDHPADSRVEGSWPTTDREAERVTTEETPPATAASDLVRERDGRHLRAPRPDDPLAKQ